ncbi:permease prefix domain 1-containing protein [Deinococcus sp. PEB2-63]
MSPEEQYVRDATRGLKGQVRKDTQAELLDHLTERACQLVLSGLSHEQARAKAMQELGAPATVTRSLRREQGFTTAHQLALSTLIGLTLLTSLTANLYFRNYKPVTSVVDRVLFPPSISDPCQDRQGCLTIDGADLTLSSIRAYGLIPLNRVNAYLNGTNLHVSGLWSKVLTLPGFPDISIQATRIGRYDHPGTRGGYLNLPRTLVDAAQHGWPVPVTLNLSGTSYGLDVGGQTVPEENAIAPRVASAYLSDLLDQHLTVAVRDAARITTDLTYWTPSAWTASPLVLQRASSRATLPTPDPVRM